jgi:hypothetical protein
MVIMNQMYKRPEKMCKRPAFTDERIEVEKMG